MLLHKKIVASFAAAGIAALTGGTARAGENLPPSQPPLHLRFYNPPFHYIAKTTSGAYIYDPDADDDGSAPAPGDIYDRTWIIHQNASFPMPGELPLIIRGHTLRAVFYHVDKDGCHEREYNGVQLERSKNADAKIAKKDLDASVAFYTKNPDEIEKAKDTPMQNPCGPISSYRIRSNAPFFRLG